MDDRPALRGHDGELAPARAGLQDVGTRSDAGQMNGAFDTDLGNSHRITLEAWKKRGFAERFKEMMWLPIQYWL